MTQIMMPFSKRQYWDNHYRARQSHIREQTSRREFCENMKSLSEKYFREMIALAQGVYAEKMPRAEIEMKCSWHPSRKNSWGGVRNKKAFISIGMVRATMPFPVKEYDLINADREIGYIHAWSSEITLATTIAHEVAHAVHALMIVKARKSKMKMDRKPHGDCWRRIYRLLRVEYVNKMVPPAEAGIIGVAGAA